MRRLPVNPRFDKLLVLDLDGTLVYSSLKPLPQRPPDFVGPYHAYKRPHVDQFLESCLSWFEVGVWTSSSRPYAEWILGHLLREPSRLSFIWTYERCTQKPNHETGEPDELKRLRKLTRKTIKGCKYPLKRIIVVDDTPTTYRDNFGNAIRLSEYQGGPEDHELLLLLQYLEMLGVAPDVRGIEKRGWRDKVRAL